MLSTALEIRGSGFLKYRCNPIIDGTDREIDVMLYELYGLTQEEIEIVEGVKQ